MVDNFYTHALLDKKGEVLPKGKYENKVVLVVNTASKCGFTPQFAGLEKLYQNVINKAENKDKFLILGFPCNQFNSQDPGTNDEIQNFCQVNYGVTFPILGKVEVNGANADKTWEWMKAEKPGIMGLKRIKWNFEKFLINGKGEVVGRWASSTKPESLESVILKEVAKVNPQTSAI